MLKTIRIEDKDIPMISNGGTLKLYRQFFKKDMLGEFLKLERAIKNEEYENIDSLSFAEMMWTCAYRANPNIQPFDEWLDSFDGPFVLLGALGEFKELIHGTMHTNVEPKKKKKKATAK